MKAAIVAAGGIAYVHLKGIQRYPGAKVVGIVDKYITKAETLGALCGNPNVYTDLEEMLEKEKPDVVHICAPPRLHYPMAKTVVEHKVNVLVEKPFTLYSEEARDLYATAEKNGVMVCGMHNHLFDKAMLKVREIVKSGEIGEVVSVDSYYGFNLGGEKSKYNVDDTVHWVFNIFGGHFSNIGPHATYMALEFLGNEVDVDAMATRMGKDKKGLPDELRMMLKNKNNQLGYVTVSLNASPYLHYLNVYGTKKIIQYDIANWYFNIKALNPKFPNAVARAWNNIQVGFNTIAATTSATVRSLTGRLTHYDGMWELIRQYYQAIENGTEPPVTKDQVIATVATLENAFHQIEEGEK